MLPEVIADDKSEPSHPRAACSSVPSIGTCHVRRATAGAPASSIQEVLRTTANCVGGPLCIYLAEAEQVEYRRGGGRPESEASPPSAPPPLDSPPPQRSARVSPRNPPPDTAAPPRSRSNAAASPPPASSPPASTTSPALQPTFCGVFRSRTSRSNRSRSAAPIKIRSIFLIAADLHVRADL